MRLGGKKAVITGGGRGIGRAIALGLAVAYVTSPKHPNIGARSSAGAACCPDGPTSPILGKHLLVLRRSLLKGRVCHFQ